MLCDRVELKSKNWLKDSKRFLIGHYFQVSSVKSLLYFMFYFLINCNFVGNCSLLKPISWNKTQRKDINDILHTKSHFNSR